MSAGRGSAPSYRGKRVVVVGLAREGIDLARFLNAEGARVTVTDTKRAELLDRELAALEDLRLRYILGGHPIGLLLDDTEALFVSPGVSQETPLVQEARRRGIEVSSATRLFFQRCPGRIVGITGSSGKGTTTGLVGEMLRAAGRDTRVGGNIGVPLLGQLATMTEQTWVVLELSSFQLETLDASPRVAAITNIAPNHLDRHGTMEAYVAAKRHIFEFQSSADWCILNADDAASRQFAPPSRVLRFSLEHPVEGAYLRGETLYARLGDTEQMIASRSDSPLRGRHNLANTLAACAVALACGVEVTAMRRGIQAFTGLPHRLQPVGEVQGVQFVDDSIATSPDRALAALRAFDEPLVVIAGGRDKHLPLDEWAAALAQRARHVVLLGELADPIAAALRRVAPGYAAISHVGSMQEAVARAFALAEPGTIVLLSPGGTSFDMFADFEARGRAFQTAVRALRERVGA